MTLTRMIATFGGVGNLRPAPGTWGSLAALPVAWGLHVLGGFWLLLMATVAAFGLGWWATIVETRGRPTPTRPRLSSTKWWACGSRFGRCRWAR